MNTDRSVSTPTLVFAEAGAMEAEVTKTFLEYLHTLGERGDGVRERVAAMYHSDVIGYGTGAHERFISHEVMLASIQQEREELPERFTVDVDSVEVHPVDAVASMVEDHPNKMRFIFTRKSKTPRWRMRGRMKQEPLRRDNSSVRRRRRCALRPIATVGRLSPIE